MFTKYVLKTETIWLNIFKNDHKKNGQKNFARVIEAIRKKSVKIDANKAIGNGLKNVWKYLASQCLKHDGLSVCLFYRYK